MTLTLLSLTGAIWACDWLKGEGAVTKPAMKSNMKQKVKLQNFIIVNYVLIISKLWFHLYILDNLFL